jgi:hypothetical protein
MMIFSSGSFIGKDVLKTILQSLRLPFVRRLFKLDERLKGLLWHSKKVRED